MKRNEYFYILLQRQLQDTMLGEKRKVEKSAYRMLPKYNGGQVQNKIDISIPKGTWKEGITNPKQF